MITKAKVNISSVKMFRVVVTSIGEYSVQFKPGIGCLEEMMVILNNYANNLSIKISELHIAHAKLEKKILELKVVTARIKSQYEQLKVQINLLRTRLATTSPFIIYADEEGKVHKEANPEYEALKSEIDQLETEARDLENELHQYQQRLNKANDVDSRLTSHIDAMDSVVYALSEKTNICEQLVLQLEEIRQSNRRCSIRAEEGLKKIERIVGDYIKTKMRYDDTDVLNRAATNISPSFNINFNIESSKSTVINEYKESKTVEVQNIKIGKLDIIRHRIKFDEHNRICKYDGKQFGGEYSSYEERVKRTPKASPFYGRYTGIRGESKYVPTDKTANGLKIISLLAKYGLDGIEYRNGEPDFEVCSEAIVTIQNMTENRYDYRDVEGISRHGNFTQADEELARLWNIEKREKKTDWSGRDVANYRSLNGLTWHEKCDTKTMVLVKLEINDYFGHSGGCSECRKRDGMGIEEGGFDE